MLISNSRFRFKPVVDRLRQISLWIILLGTLFGCRTSSISVEDISQKKVDKTVYLTGKVVHISPFIDYAAYQLEDATGKTWVVTAQKSPVLGQQINLKGKIKYQSFPFAEQELGDFYVVELEQLPLLSDESAK